MIDRLAVFCEGDPESSLPTLNAANGVDRQQRLERRIACAQLQHPDWDRDACYDQAYHELAPSGATQSGRGR
ncbi:hypothetical protein [Paraburkholderia sp. GAS33]|uniref:hypothetical protein n=1 Tax=Paraburkholderia sp. GAS33 TaxID=3035130 RepID=UPI003D20BD4B